MTIYVGYRQAETHFTIELKEGDIPIRRIFVSEWTTLLKHLGVLNAYWSSSHFVFTKEFELLAQDIMRYPVILSYTLNDFPQLH